MCLIQCPDRVWNLVGVIVQRLLIILQRTVFVPLLYGFHLISIYSQHFAIYLYYLQTEGKKHKRRPCLCVFNCHQISRWVKKHKDLWCWPHVDRRHCKSGSAVTHSSHSGSQMVLFHTLLSPSATPAAYGHRSKRWSCLPTLYTQEDLLEALCVPELLRKPGLQPSALSKLNTYSKQVRMEMSLYI